MRPPVIEQRQGVEIYSLNGVFRTPAVNPQLQWPQIGLADTVRVTTDYTFIGLTLSCVGEISSVGGANYFAGAYVIVNKTAPVLTVSSSIQCLASQLESFIGTGGTTRYARSNWVALRKHGIPIKQGSCISLYLNAGEAGRQWATANLFLVPSQ